MEERCIAPRIRSGLATQALRCLLLLAFIYVPSPPAKSNEPRRLYHLTAGDAALMLNEFSRQSNLQVLDDFNLLVGRKTRAVDGYYTAVETLDIMLTGSGLVYDFVNDRTLAVTLRKPRGNIRGLWARFKRRLESHQRPSDLDEVLIAGTIARTETPPEGAELKVFSRSDIDRSGASTTPDFLRTIPQVFGGGPAEGTVLGREQMSNTALGVGVNYRGLGAGSTIALINGRLVAPSGSSAAFVDVSNIPLSAIDHIDTISAGGSAPYGTQGVGGVLNFVMRDGFEGMETRARIGAATGDALAERQFSQLWGYRWGDATSVIALEFDRRGSLPAADRAQATSDLAPFGGTNFNTPFGTPGTIVIGNQTWAIPRNQNDAALNAQQLIAGTENLHDQYQDATVLPAQERFNLYVNAKLPIADDSKLFFDALLGDRRLTDDASGLGVTLMVPNSNPFYVNPTGGMDPIALEYGLGSDLGPMKLSAEVKSGNFAVGLTEIAANGWGLSGHVGYTFEKQNDRIDGVANFAALDAALANSNPLTAFNPFGDGSNTNPMTLAAIRAQNRFDMSSALWVAHVAADRGVLTIPGGDLRLAVGADLDHQILDTSSLSSGVSLVSHQTRDVVAVFGELRAPIIGEGNHIFAIRRLDISLADRVERTSAIGAVTTPTLTAAWTPVSSLTVRASSAHFYRAPNLADQSEVTAGSEITSVPDATSASGATSTLVSYGGSRNLKPERARNWSFGFDFSPPAVSGLMVSVTHYRAQIQGRVNSIPLSADVLTNPIYSDFVTRNPSAQQRAAVCQHGNFVGDLETCLTSPVGALLDASLLNIDSIKTQGIDIAAKFREQSGPGEFVVGLDGSYIFQFSEAVTPSAPAQELVNTAHYPLAVRMRGSFAYSIGGMGMAAFLNYSGRYRDTDSVPERSVGAWTTLDLQLSYELRSESQRVMNGLRFSVSVQNLFGTNPPFLNSQVGIGYDQENAQLTGRVMSLTIRKRW